MKTYILRQPPTVQPQTQRPQGVSAAALPGQPVAPAARGPALFIGLDVHTKSIAVSLAPSDATEVRRYGEIGGTHDDVLKLAQAVLAQRFRTRLNTRCNKPTPNCSCTSRAKPGDWIGWPTCNRWAAVNRR